MKKLPKNQTVCVSKHKQDNPCDRCLRNIDLFNIGDYEDVKEFKPISNRCDGYLSKIFNVKNKRKI